MNQAWVGGSSPDPNSAVPVLPAVPEGKPTSAAVPSLTTAGISACSALLTAGSSFFGGTGLRPFASRACDASEASTRRGECQVPEAAAAATLAMLSGLVSTLP